MIISAGNTCEAESRLCSKILLFPQSCHTVENNVLNDLHNNQSQKKFFIKFSILRVNAIQLNLLK